MKRWAIITWQDTSDGGVAELRTVETNDLLAVRDWQNPATQGAVMTSLSDYARLRGWRILRRQKRYNPDA